MPVKRTQTFKSQRYNINNSNNFNPITTVVVTATTTTTTTTITTATTHGVNESCSVWLVLCLLCCWLVCRCRCRRPALQKTGEARVSVCCSRRSLPRSGLFFTAFFSLFFFGKFTLGIIGKIATVVT